MTAMGAFVPLPSSFTWIEGALVATGVLLIGASGWIQSKGPDGNRWAWYAIVAGFVLAALATISAY